MTEYDKCQNLTRLTQRPRGCQNSKMVLKDSSKKMIRMEKKKKDHVAILTIKDKTDKEAVKMHECRVRRAEGSATLDSAQGYTEQRDVLLLKRWRDLAARKQSSVG